MEVGCELSLLGEGKGRPWSLQCRSIKPRAVLNNTQEQILLVPEERTSSYYPHKASQVHVSKGHQCTLTVHSDDGTRHNLDGLYLQLDLNLIIA